MVPDSQSEPVVAVVVAAGSGVRLGGEVPKSLRTLSGAPLVVHAVNAVVAAGAREIVVVASEETKDHLEGLFTELGLPVVVCLGGARRQDSVAAGLAALTATDAVVLVHDAARPLVPESVVRRVIAAVADGATAVVPVIPVVDSIRRVASDGTSVVVDRENLRSVQTPQGFDLASLRAAHRKIAEQGDQVTDDAAACEAAGQQVVLVEGSPRSLKITTATDLVMAEALIAEPIAPTSGPSQ